MMCELCDVIGVMMLEIVWYDELTRAYDAYTLLDVCTALFRGWKIVVVYDGGGVIRDVVMKYDLVYFLLC